MSNALEDQKIPKSLDNGNEFDSSSDGGKAEEEEEEGEEDENQGMDEEEDEEENFDDYYTNNEYDYEMGCAQINKQLQEDPEYFDFQCLDYDQMVDYFARTVDDICKRIQVSASIAKILLINNKWNVEQIINQYESNKQQLFASSRLHSSLLALNNNNLAQADNNASDQPCFSNTSIHKQSLQMCDICLQSQSNERMQSLSCGHNFCVDCWKAHVHVKLQSGVALGIECMAQHCRCPLPDDLAVMLLGDGGCARRRYDQFAVQECIASHPLMQRCPGPDCEHFFLVQQPLAKRVQCSNCGHSCCFKCKLDYHAPTDCSMIRQWLAKCEDDSETANYISANTKDCPRCHVCIEKNGGCNHMQCFSCKLDFCWMCLGDWRTHGTEYYECSRFKEQTANAGSSTSSAAAASAMATTAATTAVITQQQNAKAREALKKYLFYYERWENHARSLRLEEQTLENIKARVQEKVMKESASGNTWIDWQYLFDAAALLAKCRYTLQYTYPYAYFMSSGPRKQLFEYQQAQLEAEIEALSWKVERSETYDRADMENQMDVAEKRRATLLKDFLPV